MEINKIADSAVNNISKLGNIANYSRADMDGGKVADNNADDKNLIAINNQKGIGKNINIQA